MKLRSEKEGALLTEANNHVSTLNTDIEYLKRKIDDQHIQPTKMGEGCPCEIR
jgi:hypothetical protein